MNHFRFRPDFVLVATQIVLLIVSSILVLSGVANAGAVALLP